MPNSLLDARPESLDITDLDFDVNVPETDFADTKHMAASFGCPHTTTLRTMNAHSRCVYC